jgi:hypothetical protein
MRERKKERKKERKRARENERKTEIDRILTELYNLRVVDPVELPVLVTDLQVLEKPHHTLLQQLA